MHNNIILANEMTAIHNDMNTIKDQYFFPNIEKLQKAVIANANKNNAKESAQRLKVISDLLHLVDVSKGTISERKLIQQAIARTGDLTANVEINTGDEFSEMANQLNTMNQNLKTVVSNIISGADNIYQNSSEMSNASDMMSRGATMQAASAEKLSSSSQTLAVESENLKKTVEYFNIG